MMTVSELISKLLDLDEDEALARDSEAHVVACTTVKYEIVDVAVDRAGVACLILGVTANQVDPEIKSEQNEWPGN